MSGPEYDRVHRSIRQRLLEARQPGDRCVRCGRPLPASDAKIDLGHTDDGLSYSGLECSKCNRAAGAAKTNQLRRERREQAGRRAAGVAEVALAIEISADRGHASLVTAGYLEGDLILLTLAGYLEYLDSSALVAAVLAVRERHEVLALVVDPHSPGATAIRPLEAARIKVTKLTTTDLAVAHGGFVDATRAGRIRHQSQEQLTAAMRHLEARRIGGSTGPERRGTADVAPGVAAELAVWGLECLPAPVQPFFELAD